jgi:hypothetical protein
VPLGWLLSDADMGTMDVAPTTQATGHCLGPDRPLTLRLVCCEGHLTIWWILLWH